MECDLRRLRRRVVAQLDEMLVGIHEVDGFAGSSCTVFVAWSMHVPRIVERVAEGNSRPLNASERRVELGLRHRERKVHMAFGTPWRELQREVFRDTDDCERRSDTVVVEAEHIGVETEALACVVDRHDDVVEADGHAASLTFTALTINGSRSELPIGTRPRLGSGNPSGSTGAMPRTVDCAVYPVRDALGIEVRRVADCAGWRSSTGRRPDRLSVHRLCR